MALEILEKDTDGVTVLELAGQVVLGEESNKFRKTMRDVLEKGKNRLVLDLGNVRRIDSAGLGALVSSYTSAQTQGARLKLARATDKVRSLLQISKLVTVFETYPTVEAATKSFGPSA
jgi:anti-sigma B factor antagonist